MLFFLINKNHFEYDYNLDGNYFKVKEVRENYSIISQNNSKLLFYQKKECENIFKDDLLYLKGDISSIKNSYNEFYKYLEKRVIYQKMEASECRIIKRNPSLVNKLIQKMDDKHENQANIFFDLILFNKRTSENREIFDTFSFLSISHLIAISGMHINFLITFLNKIFFFVGKKKREVILFMIMSLYLNALNYSVSSMRSFLYYISKKFNKKIDFSLTNIDLLSLIGITLLFINPSNVFMLGFIYSFIFSISIELIKNIYKEENNKNKLYILFNVYLLSVPLILYFNFELNVFTLFLILSLSNFIKVIFISSFISYFIPFLNFIYVFFLLRVQFVFAFLEEISLTIVFGRPSLAFIFIYYFLYVIYLISLEKKEGLKSLLCLSLILFLLLFKYSQPYFSSEEKVAFINVGQGDSFVFFIPNSKEVVLYDTGGSIFKDVANRDVIPYLKKNNVNSINKIIISHFHFDHYGGVENLIKDFNVEKVVSDPNREVFMIGNQEFKNLNISNSNQDDKGSIVLYGKYLNKKILLTGDIFKKQEENIIDSFDLDVDILKVAHHGSNTSSSSLFLDKTNPKIALIGVGRNNYGHPSSEVINKLKKREIQIFRTDLNNHIKIKEGKDGNLIITYFDN